MKKCNQSIRCKLTVWYVLLFTVILLVIDVFSYSFHVCGHYDDIDNDLVNAASQSLSSLSSNTYNPFYNQVSGRFQVIIRYFQKNGDLLTSGQSQQQLPNVNPIFAQQHPMGPAFDFLAGITPPIEKPIRMSGGTFYTVEFEHTRWRIYTVPVTLKNTQYYIETITSLAYVDDAVGIFRLALLGVSLFGLTAALIGGYFIAKITLKPIAAVINTISAIGSSHDLSQRLQIPLPSDEIGKLIITFNDMLFSLQQAEIVQQRFIADASHELRAPVTVIKANLDLIQRYEIMDPHELSEIFSAINKEADHMNSLVADLLLLARADAHTQLDMAEVHLDELILETMQVANNISHQHTFLLDQFEIITIPGNTEKLRQMMLNIVSNAIKYTPPGGEIRVKLTKVAATVVISVSDTGIGISAEDLPYIFDRFYRADPSRSRSVEGTGLGLTIVRWIVEQHRGAIEVESELGIGTCFTITLPLK